MSFDQKRETLLKDVKAKYFSRTQKEDFEMKEDKYFKGDLAGALYYVNEFTKHLANKENPNADEGIKWMKSRKD